VRILNNKGAVGWEEILALVVVAVLAVVLFSLLKPTASEAGTFFSSETLKVRDDKCKLDTQRAGITLTPQNDRDGDGRLDACDVCVCSTDKCKNDNDDDLDGMPNGCDKGVNDRTIIGCTFTITKDGRCCDGCPPST